MYTDIRYDTIQYSMVRYRIQYTLIVLVSIVNKQMNDIITALIRKSLVETMDVTERYNDEQ